MPGSCFHCGEDIPPNFHAQLEVDKKPESFCCYGCLAVAETIITGGLENFYKHRTELSKKAVEVEESEQAELLLYDEPELQKTFVQDLDNNKEAALSISGITCAACIWLLEKEIKRVAGVQDFTVNHTSHKARLLWNPSKTKLSDVLLAIRKLGYHGNPYNEDQARVNQKQERRSTIFRIAVAGIATMQNMMFSVPLYLGYYSGIDEGFLSLFRWVSLVMCAPVVLYSATPFFKAAWRDINNRHLTMDVPVSLAILVAFFASAYITIFETTNINLDVYYDSVSMFTFFLLMGRFVEMQARHKHLDTDTELTRLLPASATVIRDGQEQVVPAFQIEVGDHFLVKQGQVSAADGEIITGHTRFDESALTGEFLPVGKHPGDSIAGGTANIENTVEVKATATVSNSRISAILRMLDSAQSEKPKTVQIADRIASRFVAFVLFTTFGAGLAWFFIDAAEAFPVALSVLVVTCPCALSLATPTALTAATTMLRREGFLITKGHVLEAMNEITDVSFDKTGTLTEGKLAITQVNSHDGFDKNSALIIAAALESHSNHPIAKVFAPYFQSSADSVENHIGRGIEGSFSSMRYRIGTLDYILEFTQDVDFSRDQHHQGLIIYLASEEGLVAEFLLSDRLRETSKSCVAGLTNDGLTVHMLSGDQSASVKQTAQQLRINHAEAGKSPEQKLGYIKDLQQKGAEVAMIGDGINDLPVLAGARLSVAMNQSSDIAKLNADAVLLNDNLNVLNKAFKASKETRKVIKQNMAWAIGYNLCMLPMAAVGLIPPYFAALGMSLSSLIVVFNSVKLAKPKR